MATLADELLNDFEASGSEDEGKNELIPDEAAVDDEDVSEHTGAMEVDGDNKGVAEEDAETGEKLGEGVPEDDAKAQVEKMQLGGVGDVRNVARLMKTLQPILDVSCPRFPSDFELVLIVSVCLRVYMDVWTNRPDLFASHRRKYRITSPYRQNSEPRRSGRPRIIPNITCLPNRTLSRRRLTTRSSWCTSLYGITIRLGSLSLKP